MISWFDSDFPSVYFLDSLPTATANSTTNTIPTVAQIHVPSPIPPFIQLFV